ncbi:hypothetical protein ACF0H5_010983 [Mactra antiquata]
MNTSENDTDTDGGLSDAQNFTTVPEGTEPSLNLLVDNIAIERTCKNEENDSLDDVVIVAHEAENVTINENAESVIDAVTVAHEAENVTINENAESVISELNDEKEICTIVLDCDRVGEEDETYAIKHGYSEEIVQLLPSELPEHECIDLDSMNVMHNNFFREKSENEENKIDNSTNENGSHELELDITKQSEELESRVCSSNEDSITDPDKCFEARWITTNNKTYNFCIPSSNVHRLIDINHAGSSIFDMLPEELIVKIFSFLTTEELCLHAAPVCRKWRSISHDHSLWKSLDFSVNPLLSSLNFLWVIRRAPLLQRLIVSGRACLTHPEVAIFTECCQFLEDIDFGFCNNLSCEMIRTVSDNCTHLKRINVEGCEKVDYRCSGYLARCCELTHINLSHCTAICDRSVSLISRKLPNLLSINLDGIDSITDSAVDVIVSQHCEHLQEIELDGAEISDIGIQHLSLCKQLKCLELSFAECLTDQALEYIQELKNLEVLRLRKGYDLSDEAISKLFKTGSLSKLQCLNLSECSRITDEVVLDIVQACGVTLKDLSLSWCWSITDKGLISIVDHCCNMENLDLLGIDKIRGDCLDRIPEEMSKLKYLDLRQCNRIVDSLIVDVVRRKPDLKVLNYYGEEFVHNLQGKV